MSNFFNDIDSVDNDGLIARTEYFELWPNSSINLRWLLNLDLSSQ